MANYERMRRDHKPKKIDLLLLAESPPMPRNGHAPFFYDDSEGMVPYGLFQATMKALYPLQWLKVKTDFLTAFKDESRYYLIDASSVPLESKGRKKKFREIRAAGTVIDTIKNLADEGSFEGGQVKLIIVGKTMHKIFYDYLIENSQIETSKGRFVIVVLNKNPFAFPHTRESTEEFISELGRIVGRKG